MNDNNLTKKMIIVMIRTYPQKGLKNVENLLETKPLLKLFDGLRIETILSR